MRHASFPKALFSLNLPTAMTLNCHLNLIKTSLSPPAVNSRLSLLAVLECSSWSVVLSDNPTHPLPSAFMQAAAYLECTLGASCKAFFLLFCWLV